MKEKQLSRRDFLHMTGMVAAGTSLAACQPATIQGGATGGSGPSAAPVTLAWCLPRVRFAIPKLAAWQVGGRPSQNLCPANPQRKDRVPGIRLGLWPRYYTGISAGDPPDLILRGGFRMLTYALQAGNALEVDLKADLKDDLPGGWYDGMLWQGKNYFIPFYVLAQGTILNVSIAKEAGAEIWSPKRLAALGTLISGWNS